MLFTSLMWVLLATCPIGWLPPTHEAGSLLGPLLGAQAAIAALTLAVTLFVMQGVSARRDVDDRMYQEYVRRSWVKPIFWGSIIAVGVTGLALLAEELGTGAPLVGSSPGLRNLTLLAAIAFLVNLGLPVLLFERRSGSLNRIGGGCCGANSTSVLYGLQCRHFSIDTDA